MELEPRIPDFKAECAFQRILVHVISEMKETKSKRPAYTTWDTYRSDTRQHYRPVRT